MAIYKTVEYVFMGTPQFPDLGAIDDFFVGIHWQHTLRENVDDNFCY